MSEKFKTIFFPDGGSTSERSCASPTCSRGSRASSPAPLRQAAGIARAHAAAAHRPRRRRRAQVTAEHLRVRLPIPAHRLRAAATPSPTMPWTPSRRLRIPRHFRPFLRRLLGSTRARARQRPAVRRSNQWARQPPAAAYTSSRRQLTGSSVNYPVNGGSSRCDGGGVHSILLFHRRRTQNTPRLLSRYVDILRKTRMQYVRIRLLPPCIS
jgi:hypothetical protein